MSIREKIINLLGGITKEEHLKRRNAAYAAGYEHVERDIMSEQEHIYEEFYQKGVSEGRAQALDEIEIRVKNKLRKRKV